MVTLILGQQPAASRAGRPGRGESLTHPMTFASGAAGSFKAHGRSQFIPADAALRAFEAKRAAGSASTVGPSAGDIDAILYGSSTKETPLMRILSEVADAFAMPEDEGVGVLNAVRELSA